MKNLMKTSVLALAAIFFISSTSFAALNTNDKTVEKARSSVSKAAPDDWETRARCAQMCIKKGVNLTEAKEWLDSSLSIKESALGMEVAGDYYMANKLYEKALSNYVTSMKLMKEKDFYADTDDIQQKINKANKKV